MEDGPAWSLWFRTDSAVLGDRGERLTRTAIAVAAIVLAAVQGWISFGLPGDADITRHSSGIFDMDVQRVVVDLTTDHAGYRTSVHPLQKLLVAPAGIALNAAWFGGENRLATAKLLIVAITWLQTLLVGWLAWLWSDRSLMAAGAAAGLSAFSFSSILAVSLPESAAFASIGATLPLLLLASRNGRPFTRWEAFLWAGVGVVCIGLTITQIVHWAIALCVRAWLGGREGAGPVAAGVAMSVATFVALTWLGVLAQSALFPGTQEFYAHNPIAGEQPFMRLGAIVAQPIAHTLRLLSHFALYDFVAPAPGYSDFLIRDYGFDYWSLSIEATGLAQWSVAQGFLAASVLGAVGAGLFALRGADARFVAPALCVASQFGLHFLYGREYVLYSPNWHGVWVALLVAAAWNRYAAQRTYIFAVSALLAVAMLANGVAVMGDVYREVEVGLHVDARDAFGAPKR